MGNPHVISFGGRQANQFSIQKFQLAWLVRQLFKLRKRQQAGRTPMPDIVRR